jgi:hypothetical protein
MPETAPTTRWSMLIFLLVWLLSAVYLGVNLNKGWVPHDEGTLGQSAERVLDGEILHRDFHTGYTGGLAYIDAAIFKLFGINLFWLRLFLFAIFLAWVPAIYALARQFLAPWPAAGVTLVAVAWSVPNYPAAMPTWFNLFFATFGTLALAKYIRTPATHWLLLAGLCGGCSFLFKSVAIYYIAGALLFFVYREQLLSRSESGPRQRTPLYLSFLALSLSVFVLALLKLVFALGDVPEYLHFVFPGVALALLLAYGEWTSPTVSDFPRFRALFGMAGPFLLASAVPVALFAFYYWYRGALPALINDLFAVTLRQLAVARRAPAGLVYEYPPVIAALFIIEVAKLRGQPRRFLSVFLAVFAALVLFFSRRMDLVLTVGLASVLGMIPVLVVAALLVLLVRQPKNSASRIEGNQQIVLFLSMTVLLSLVQFPFSGVTYFCYVATLVALLAASLISRFERPPRVIVITVVVFYVLYAATVTNVHFMGDASDADYASTPLALPRAGGIRVPKIDATQYMELIPFIQGLAGDHPIFAGPDCPEVYFLAGLKNPTPIFFDYHEQPQDYENLLRAVFERSALRVVVINESPKFSVPQSKLLHELVSSRFPQSRKIGSFTVYWRP